MYRYSWLLVSLALATKAIAAGTQCDLAGPGFPAPSELSSSNKLVEAIATFEKLLDDGLRANNTAWTVALFSSKEKKTLYEQYHTPEIDVGVATVNEHSIFRIASISKVFSVWSFLIEVGDERFGDPITKYVPELLDSENSISSRNCSSSVIYDDIDRVKWEEVTLGQLASHAAGITRDRKSSHCVPLTCTHVSDHSFGHAATGSDLAGEFGPEQARAFGFPALDPSEIPACGLTNSARTCTRSGTLILKRYDKILLIGGLELTTALKRNARIRTEAAPPFPYSPLSSLHEPRIRTPRLRSRGHHRNPDRYSSHRQNFRDIGNEQQQLQ